MVCLITQPRWEAEETLKCGQRNGVPGKMEALFRLTEGQDQHENLRRLQLQSEGKGVME